MSSTLKLNSAKMLVLLSALSGCTDNDNGRADLGAMPSAEPSEPTSPVIISQSDILPFGSMFCPAGGDVTREGADANGDGELSADEVETTEYLCQETPDAELGQHRHVVKFVGDAVVHHRMQDRATGHILVEAFPLGQGHVGRADHTQVFTTQQLAAFHDLMTDRTSADAALGSPVSSASTGSGMRRLAGGSSMQTQATSNAEDVINALYHAGSVSSCEVAYAAGDPVCGLAVGTDADPEIGQLASSAGCFWLDVSSISSGLTLSAGLSAMASGETISDSMNISGKVSASYGAFAGSDKFSYSSSYSSSEYGGSQSFQNYYLVQPSVAVADDPYVSGRSSDTVAQDLNCGTEYQTTPTIGMVVGGTMNYQFDSESTSSTFENTVKVSYGKGLTSASAKMSTTIANASSDTSSSFDFTVTLYGGGAAAAMFIDLYGSLALGSSGSSDDFYTQCFSGADQTACTNFFAAVDQATTQSLSYLGRLWDNQWAAVPDSSLPAPTKDISFMATFPDGYDGVFTASATATVPSIASNDRGVGGAMKDHLPLLNELSTLSLRAETLMTSDATSTSGQLQLGAELASLGSIYDQDRKLVLAAVQQCLLGKDDSTAANDCGGIQILKDAEIYTAYDYYDQAYAASVSSGTSSSVMDDLIAWYTSKGLSVSSQNVSTKSRLSARENAVVLPLSGSLTACTRDTGNKYDCNSDFKEMQNASMVAVWLPTMPTSTGTPTALQDKSGIVVFPLVDYLDNVTKDAALASGGQVYWVLVDASSKAGGDGVATLFNALTGASSGNNGTGSLFRMKANSFESDYSGASVEVNNDNGNACTDFSMSSTAESAAYCQLSMLLDWSENDETARFVTPKSIVVSEYIDNGDNERQVWPPKCTWATIKDETCETQFVMTGFGSGTGGNDVHYLAARYTNINRIGFGARDENGEIITFDNDTVGDQYHYYTDPAGVVSGERKVLLSASDGELMTGFGITSQDSKVTHVGAYYRTVASYTDQLYSSALDTFDLTSLAKKVIQDPAVSGATSLDMEVNVPGNDAGTIMAMALRVKSGDEKAASYAWGKIKLDSAQLPKSTLVLRRDASFYGN